MKISIRIKGGNKTTKFARWAKDKIADAFSKLSDQVRSIEAYFSDLNGPKGGRDQNLLLAVRLWDGRMIAVRSVDDDIGRVLDTGVDRSLHTVLRQIHRTRSMRRRWRPLPEVLAEEASS